MKTIVIKGFGRIGRLFLRRLFIVSQNSFRVLSISEKALTINEAAYLLKYDSSYGVAPFDVEVEDGKLVIFNDKQRWVINYFESLDCCKADYLLDSSGSEKIIKDSDSLPFEKVFFTYLPKRLHNHFYNIKLRYVDNNHKFVFCGICDSVSIVPILDTLNPEDIESIGITTLHPFLNYQNLLDGKSIDNNQLQVGRSSFNNVIPKQSSVPAVLSMLVPSLSSKIHFMTYRVPTNAVTTCDINILFKEKVCKEKICAIKDRIENNKFDNFPHTSIDFINMDDREYGIDTTCTKIDGNNLHITIFYNNETTYVGYVIKMLLDNFS